MALLRFNAISLILLGAIGLCVAIVLYNSKSELLSADDVRAINNSKPRFIISKTLYSLILQNWKTTSSNSASTFSAIDETTATKAMFGGVEILRLTGQGSFYARDFIPVQTNKRYRLSVKLRIKSLDSVEHRIQTLIGLATFDQSGKLETTSPGTHRYGVHVGNISSDAGWQTLSADFMGTLNKADNFRPTTKTVKPVILFNQVLGEGVVTEIMSITFSELKNIPN